MTLRELKERVLQLIEEVNPDVDSLTDDEDINFKINAVIDQVQNELSDIKKISEKAEYTVDRSNPNSYVLELQEELEQFYQLDRILYAGDYEVIGRDVHFDEDFEGDVLIYYYKYPKSTFGVKGKEDEESFVIELDNDLLQILPYGVAGDLLKSDMISGNGQHYQARYNELISRLDPRTIVGNIRAEGGYDV